MADLPNARDLQTRYMSGTGGAIYLSQFDFLTSSMGRYALLAAIDKWAVESKNSGTATFNHLLLNVGQNDYMSRALGYGAQAVAYSVRTDENGKLVFSLSMKAENYDFVGDDQTRAIAALRQATNFLLDPAGVGKKPL